MRYFELSTPRDLDNVHWSGTYRATRKWCLPGIDCPRCTPWSGMLAYPSVDLSNLTENDSLTSGWPQPLEEYARRAALVRPYVPQELPIEPGCSFGPLVGTSMGRFGPVTARPSWEVLVREDTLASIQEAGLKGIIPVRAELRNRRTKELPQYELEARSLVKLHPACIQDRDRVPTCEYCGRNGFSLPPERWLLGASIPTDLDLFGVEDTTRIVVSERFVDTVNRLGPSDVVYREISVE
ncbi:SitI6 family double-CXXCG motif immunity protein [Corallococcus sp. M7]